MKTYIIPEDKIEEYRQTVLTEDLSCSDECLIKLSLLGIASEEMDIEEAKRQAKLGDCILIRYLNIYTPMQVVHKTVTDDGTLDVYLMSYLLLEKHIFDERTNIYKDSAIRRYINSEDFLNKFDPDFINGLKPEVVHTNGYKTVDKVWLLSHDEIGYKDDTQMFEPNEGAFIYDYFKSA